MRKRSTIVSFVLFVVISLILFFVGEKKAAFVAGGFSSFLLVALLGFYLIDFRNKRKLDPDYKVLKKEHLLAAYDKLVKEYENEKLKAVCLVYLKLAREYDFETIKSFSQLLLKDYKIDPVGYDGGYVVLFANIHELLLPEIIKQLRIKLQQLNLEIEFKYGFSYYTSGKNYQIMLEEAKNVLK